LDSLPFCLPKLPYTSLFQLSSKTLMSRKFSKNFRKIFRSHFALADFAFCFLIVFYVALVIFIVVSEVLRFIELREREKISAIEMQTRTRGSTPSDAYYYHTRKNFSSKVQKFWLFSSLGVQTASASTAMFLRSNAFFRPIIPLNTRLCVIVPIIRHL